MRIIIIGNGIAANTSAHTIRKLNKDAEILIISKEPYPLYSACILPNYLGAEIDRDRIFLKRDSDYDEAGIKTLLGQRVTSIQWPGKRISLEADDMTYDKLILAVGSKPVVLPVDGCDKVGIFTFKSIKDADNINNYGGKRAAVVGSGPIGIEVAMALKRRDYEVTLIELLGQILPQVFDEGPALRIQNFLENQGIKVFTREKVVQFMGSGSVEAVVTQKRQIKCDLVVLAVGMRPQTDLARASGIEIGGFGGILTDDHMLTSVPDVYACGDCAQSKDRFTGEDSLSLLWHNARRQGEIAGYHATGVSRSYPGSIGIAVLDLYGTQAVSIGRPSQNIVGETVDVVEKSLNGDYYRLILAGRKLGGLQMIGRRRDTGVLLNMMLRKDNPSALLKRLSYVKQGATKIGWQSKIMGHWRTHFHTRDVT